MRYIDRTNCKSMHDRGEDKEIKTLGALTRTATKIAEKQRLGVLKLSHGGYKVIRESGLGAYEDQLESLAEVDAYLKNLDSHRDARI